MQLMCNRLYIISNVVVVGEKYKPFLIRIPRNKQKYYWEAGKVEKY